MNMGDYAELQFVGDKEVGDHSTSEIKEMDALLRDHNKKVAVYRVISLQA